MSDRPVSSDLHRAARWYARRGWHVFPLRPGEKTPLPGSRGFHDATTDLAQIDRWWTAMPDANIGIATGASALCVLDLDVAYEKGIDGIAEWNALKSAHGIDDDTPTVETGGGGLQLYFLSDDKDITVGASKLAPGVDHRANGGYVVAPPSIHPNGQPYVWAMGLAPDEAKMLPLPDTIVKRLRKPAASPPARVPTVPAAGEEWRWLERALDRLEDFPRNDTGLWLANQLRDSGADETTAGVVMSAYAAMCPQDPHPYTSSEAMATLRSSYGREPREPAHIGERNTNGGDRISSPCPDLPYGVLPDAAPHLGGFVDEYVAYARQVSPMTPDAFHESAALAIASAAIARRLVVPMPFGNVYPTLWVCWFAPTTLYRKTTALDVAHKLVIDSIPHLLAASETTPEAMLSDMAGRQPTGWDQMTSPEQEGWRRERDFCAQRVLILDGLSGILAGMGKDYNAGLMEAFLRFYDGGEKPYTRSTRGQGRVTVTNGALSILGASTPQAMAMHLLEERLWANGWWARFALLSPEGQPEWKVPTAGERPQSLQRDLSHLHTRLPEQTYPDSAKSVAVTLDDGVYQAWEKYNKALSYDLLLDDGMDHRFNGPYGRLAVQALKVATLLAALDWPDEQPCPRVTVAHLSRAILITESWRRSAHRTLESVCLAKEETMEDRALKMIKAGGEAGADLRDIYRTLNVSRGEAEMVCRGLEKDGLIEAFQRKTTRRPAQAYRACKPSVE